MRHYSNVSKVMALQNAPGTSGTSIIVDDASGLPSTFPFNVVLDYEAAAVEVVSVTSVAGNTLTVVRGQEDTAAQAHSIGAVVVHAATALDFQDAAAHQAASTNVHGVGGTASVVGTDTAQTLTNKTISGASNTLTNIPAGQVTGSFSNLVTSQTSAASPGLKVNKNAAPASNIVELGDNLVITSGGQLQTAAGGGTYAQRWYAADFSSQVAEMSSAGRLTCVGLTTTGSITATGQAATVGALSATTGAFSSTTTFAGLATFNAGLVIPTGQSATINAGGVLSLNGTATMAGAVTFTSAGSVTFSGGATLGNNKTYQVTSGSTLQVSGTAQVDGAISRDSTTGRLLMATDTAFLSADQGTGGTGVQTLTGCSLTFTVPVGRNAIVEVHGNASADGNVGAAELNLVLEVDGVVQATYTQGRSGVNATAFQTHAMTWILALTAGSHTIALKYRNVSNTASWTWRAVATKVQYLAFW